MCIKVKKYCLVLLIGIVSVCSAPILTVFAPPVGVSNSQIFSPPPLLVPSYQETYASLRNPWGIKPIHIVNIDTETLWLARAMFSESKRHDEQELVGWTVRNRVESKYRGCTSYEDCILDPFQFSAFLPGQSKAIYYAGLTETAHISGWQKTLALAFYIRHADDEQRPFSRNVRHFYSEQSMLGPDLVPDWVGGLTPIIPQRNIRLDERRFRFYAGVR